MSLNYLLDIVFDGDAPADGRVVLYECRHCGSKFPEQTERCSVCDAEEIASYTFGTDRSESGQ